MNALLDAPNAFSSVTALMPQMGLVPEKHYLLAEVARAVEEAALKEMAVTVPLMPETATTIILRKMLTDLETGKFEALIDLGRGGPLYRVPPHCWDDIMDGDFPERGKELPRFSMMVFESRMIGREFGEYENRTPFVTAKVYDELTTRYSRELAADIPFTREIRRYTGPLSLQERSERLNPHLWDALMNLVSDGKIKFVLYSIAASIVDAHLPDEPRERAIDRMEKRLSRPADRLAELKAIWKEMPKQPVGTTNK